MNLLSLRVPLRKRRLDEIFDLALIVLRANPWRYARITLPIMAGFMLLNFAISKLLPDNRALQNGIILTILLIQASVLQLFLTALNGRIVFEAVPRFRDTARDVKSTFVSYLLRSSILGTLSLTLFLPLLVPPIRTLLTNFFLGEVIVLERLSGSALRARVAALSNRNGDRIAFFYIFAALIFGAGLLCTVYALDSLREMMGKWAEKNIADPNFDPAGMAFQLVFFPSAVYLCLCRFFLYLDTRIQGEGWDIELMLARGIEETEREPEAIQARKKSA
ncbi:MAG: hypothetical protein JNM27_19310 [Leptospirales bacterium]|nr:hypothetical protein [Leptospirales bacterium]